MKLRRKLLFGILGIISSVFFFGSCATIMGGDSLNEVSSQGSNPPLFGHVHNFKETRTEQPTCTKQGYTVYKCGCGKEEYRDYVNSLEHQFEMSHTVSPTCTQEGYTVYKCDCGKEEYRDYVNSLEHQFEMSHTVSSTCTQEGYTVYKCDCGETSKENPVKPLGHNFKEDDASVAPTAISEGELRQSCSRCTAHTTKRVSKLKTYFTYTVENGDNVLSISCEGESEFSASIFHVGDIIVTGTEVPYEEVDKVRLGENFTSFSSLLGYFPFATAVSFSSSLKEIGSMALYPGDNLEVIHFEGDAPVVADDALILNGGKSIVITYSETAKGFNGLIFGGQMLVQDGQEIPEMSLGEYAQETAKSSVSLAQDILELYHDKGQSDLLYMPYLVDLNQYVEIKDFTLELTKDCQTAKEKTDVIYDYIVDNIVYDDNATFYDVYQVFTTKRAVCAGYVGLMHDMLVAADVVSFYTRGMTLLGNYETLENILSENYSFSTHAWLSVFGEGGTVSFYDPTWGVSNKEMYKAMTAEELGAHAMTFEVELLKVFIDGMNFTQIGGLYEFLHDDGYLYHVNNYVVSRGCNAIIYNDWLSNGRTTSAGENNGSERNANGVKQPVCTIFNNGPIYNIGSSVNRFAKADGRMLLINNVYKFLLMQELRYGKEIELEYETMFDEGGMLYFKHADNSLTLVAYEGQETEITIPATVNNYPVVTIGEGFLRNNETVKRVIVSEGITEIDWYAFYRCSALQYVYLPSTLKVGLYNQAGNTTNYDLLFNDCVNLKEIEVSPDNKELVSVDGNLYNKDKSVLIRYAPAQEGTTFTLPTSVTAIGFYAFYEARLTKVVLHDHLQLINESAFQYSALEEIVVPANCVIRHSVFSWCANLRRVTIEDGIEEFGERAFSDCYSLSEIVFPSTLKSIPFQAFVTCNSLHQVILPEGVTTIAETAFAWSGVTFITLPSTLTSIGLDAFYECNRLYHINNLSDFELVYGADSYGGIARRAKSISAVRDNSHMLVKDGFVFYLGEEQNYLVNYIGTGKHVVLPESVNGQSYVLNEAAFAADVSISWITYSYADIPWIIELCHTRKYVESITIPNTVAFIPAHCFTGWISIKTIYYQGTEEEWSNFVISNAGNAELLTAEVIFLAE